LGEPYACGTKEREITVAQNKEEELVPARVQSGWRVCIDYRKVSKATKKGHFPLPSWIKY